MKKVLVLLSTFNGEKFLHEQLNSIYEQKGVAVHILVRDDGSEDKTLSILNEYKNNKQHMTIISGNNIGATRSYYYLMKYAYNNFCDYDYYAFSDQDDVWYESKLKKAVNSISSAILSSSSKVCYFFYYANAQTTDRNLKPINSNHFKLSHNLQENVVASRSLGCTQVFSRSLLGVAMKVFDFTKDFSPNTYIPLHDGWVSLVAFALNAIVVVDADPVMLYRQHDNNVIGDIHRPFMKRFLMRINRHKTGNIKSKKCKLLLDVLEKQIPNLQSLL